MSPDDFDIIGYLEDTLDDSERAAFEDELAKNKELGEALAWFRGLTGALSGEGPDDVAESIDVETLAAIAQGGTKPTPAQWRHLLLNEETRRELAMLRVPSDEVESLPFETAPLPESIRVEVEAMARGRVRGKIEDLLGVLAEGGQLLGEKTKEVVGALTGALSGLDPVPAYYLEEGPGQVGAPSPEGDRPRVESLRVEAPGACGRGGRSRRHAGGPMRRGAPRRPDRQHRDGRWRSSDRHRETGRPGRVPRRGSGAGEGDGEGSEVKNTIPVQAGSKVRA